jgi:hypothetical protein
MTNNLRRDLDELINGNRQIHVLQILKALPLAIYIEIERLSVSKLHLQKFMCQRKTLPKVLHEASNKSNIVIFIALLFVI